MAHEEREKIIEWLYPAAQWSGYARGQCRAGYDARDAEVEALKADLATAREASRLRQIDCATLRARLGDVDIQRRDGRQLLRRLVKYAREDRAATPGTTRLERCIEQVDDYLRRTADPNDILRTSTPPQPEPVTPTRTCVGWQWGCDNRVSLSDDWCGKCVRVKPPQPEPGSVCTREEPTLQQQQAIDFIRAKAAGGSERARPGDLLSIRRIDICRMLDAYDARRAAAAKGETP